jgi:nucleoside-diphosphate-sugar epimerase
MRVFVTGGTGFIGSHFRRELTGSGHDVVYLKRPGSSGQSPGSENWIERPMDRLDKSDFEGIDALVHLASPGVSPQQATFEELLYWNVTVLERMMRNASAAGIRRFLLAGTFAEYGRAADHYDTIPSDAPLLPTTPYAASKAASWMAAHALAIEKQFELGYFRIFSAYGEGQYAGNFWPSLRAAALAGEDFRMSPGEQIRDYIQVTEISRLLVKALDDPSFTPGVPTAYNLGTGTPVSMRQFAEKFWDEWNASGKLRIGALPYRENEVMRFVPSPSSIYR